MKFSTYLFDFDGTLVDSMPAYIETMTGILDECGISYGEDLIKIITPLGFMGTAQYFIKELGVNLSIEELGNKMGERAIYEYTHTIPAKENVISTLKALKDDGANLNVLTASPHLTLDPCLKRLGIFDIFANVWSCDDFNTTKANPEIYKMCAEKIGAPIDEILFVDDNLNANKSAKLSGIKVCGIFDESSKDDADAISAVADYYVHDFSHLLNL